MTIPETLVARQNPYVGTRPFKKGEILYGREQETSELLDLLIAERIVMLYSPSGAGKSSLLNAAILPKMEENGFKVLPVMRLNHEPTPDIELAPEFNRYIFSLLMCLEEAVEPSKRFAARELTSLSLKEYLTRFRERSKELDPNFDVASALVLVVDQGEEIITIAPTERDQKQAFFDQLGEALRDRSIWLLFSLREDYIARMDSYIKPIPTGFATRYRLRLLQPDEALPAIQKPAAEQHVVFTDEAARKMVNDLRMMQVQQADGTSLMEPGLYVEPVQLQVVCRRLWTSLGHSDNEIDLADLEKIGDVDTALADYYALQVATVAAKVGVRERFIRTWFDRKLITTQGIRGQVLFAPTRSDGLENTAILELEKTYLVRSEKRGGSTWFELAHDRLIRPILKNNSEWFEKNLSALQRQADVWNEESRPEGMLVTGPDFLQMQTWVNNNQSEMSPMEVDFYKASLNAHISLLREKRNNLIIRWLGIAAFIAAVFAIGLFFQARDAGHRATARALAAESLVNLSIDPELSVMLAISSQRVTGDISRENIDALHRALPDVRVEKVLRGHKNRIYVVHYSPDGRFIASGARDGLLKIWEADSGDEIQSIAVVPESGDSYGVTNLAYRSDGKELAVSTQDGNVLIYDTVSWKPLRTIIAHKKAVWGLAFSPDGSLLATGSEDFTVKLWNVASGALLATFGVEDCAPAACGKGHRDAVNSVVFSPDGKLLVSAGNDNTIRVWNVIDRKYSFTMGGGRGHQDWVLGLAFSPDGKKLASASRDRLIKIWDIATQEWVMDINGHSDWVYALVYSPDGKSLISASSDRTVRIWDTAYGRLQATLNGHSAQVFGVDINPDGWHVVSASQDETVRVWSISPTSSREILTLDGRDDVHALAYSKDGSLLASSGRSPDIKIWDAKTGALLNDLVGHKQAVEGLVWGPDGKWLVSVGRDAQAIVWDVATGEQKLVFAEHKQEIWDVALAKDGSFAASGDAQGIIYLWNPQTGQVNETLKGPFGSVSAIDISPDQKWIAVGYFTDKKVVLWNLATKTSLILGEHDDWVEAVRFNQAGNMLASAGDDGNLILWDLRTNPPSMVSKIAANRGTIYDLLFSRDGKYIITGGADGFINVYELSNPKEPDRVFSLYGFTDRVQSLDINDKNDHLAAGGSDNSVRIFTLDPNELIEQARSRLTRTMTVEECNNNFNKSCSDFEKFNILDQITIFVSRLFR
jgi:WD40 repeat protein